MRKAILLVSLVLGLLTSLLVGVDAVKAQYISTDVEYGSPFTGSIYVNQPVKFIATSSGGTPPYTYQWYTQLWPTWKPGMSYSLAPLGDEIAVPGATSSKFKFAESTSGTYSITLRVTDSEASLPTTPFYQDYGFLFCHYLLLLPLSLRQAFHSYPQKTTLMQQMTYR